MIIPESAKHWLKYQRTRKIDFETEIKTEYEKIKPFLPKEINSVLDIGCGIGGIDYFLYKNHGQPELHMLDYDKEDEKIYFGLNPVAAKYNSMEATGEFLRCNGIDRFFLHDATNGFPETHKYDVIISLLSCGYHYPIGEYLKSIIKTLSIFGVLILDIRIGSDDFIKLKEHFKTVEVICTENKARRVIVKGLI